MELFLSKSSKLQIRDLPTRDACNVKRASSISDNTKVICLAPCWVWFVLNARSVCWSDQFVRVHTAHTFGTSSALCFVSGSETVFGHKHKNTRTHAHTRTQHTRTTHTTERLCDHFSQLQQNSLILSELNHRFAKPEFIELRLGSHHMHHACRYMSTV